MKWGPFSSNSLRSLGCVLPSRCPYCPADAPPHWIGWGSYERYSGDAEDPSQRVAIPRYRCKLTRRTFSLLPDGLLPYCSERTGLVLGWLYALYARKVALNALSGTQGVARGTLRHLKGRFVRTVPLLRLPKCEGALGALTFLEGLARKGPAGVVALFRNWKEREPKHSIVGIYARRRLPTNST